MKSYSVSGLRQNLAGALDRAERGEQVIIARRNRRFRIVADAPPEPKDGGKAFFRVKDPQLLEAGWTWQWTAPSKPIRVRNRRPRKQPG